MLRLALLSLAVAGSSPALAEEAPIDLRPVAEPAPAPPVVKKKVVKVAPPLPRLRPETTEIAASEPKPPEAAEPVLAADAVDRTIETGAIAAPAPAAETAPPPEPVKAAEAPPAPAPIVKQAAAEEMPSDGLPGDPGAVPAAPTSSDASGAAPAMDGEPYQLVRTLQMLQDQIAQGSMQALAAQKSLRLQIDAQFAAMPAKTWQDRRNAEAAVTYVLSGGAPQILAKMIVMDPKPAVDPRLLGGALAYIEGHEAQANDLLGGLNPLDLPPGMAGQVALAQSALVVRVDPEKSMKLLDLARLLGTGTLVEEAALRREIFVADQLKRYDRVEVLARQYLNRFRHSIYAGNFRNRFAAAVTHMDFVKDADGFRRLDDMVANVDAPARCQIYLTVGLASLVRGNGLAGRLAAERASALAEDGSIEAARATLYRAAGSVADAKTFDEGVKGLAGVDASQLGASDQDLLAMVQATIDGVASGTNVLKKSDRQLLWLAGGKDETATPVVKRGNDALKVADALLAAAPQ